MARKILLADDSVTAQNMGRKILADAGYDVVTVNNGSAALKRVAEIKPDLIVLDVYMPGYSGLEVCQRLKDAADTAHIPVLLTVGKLEPFKAEEGRRVRADNHIVKPFEASELLSAIMRLEDRIVPQAQPGNVERLRSKGSSLPASHTESDSGWKSRLSFSKNKKPVEHEEAADEISTAASFRDFRKSKGKAAAASSPEKAVTPESKKPAPVPEVAADLPNVYSAAKSYVPDDRTNDVPTSIAGADEVPSDITPEELDALSALASKLGRANQDTETVHEATRELATQPVAEFATASPEQTEAEPAASVAEVGIGAAANAVGGNAPASPQIPAFSVDGKSEEQSEEQRSEIEIPVQSVELAAENTSAGLDAPVSETSQHEIQHADVTHPETAIVEPATVNAAQFAEEPAPVDRYDEPTFSTFASAREQITEAQTTDAQSTEATTTETTTTGTTSAGTKSSEDHPVEAIAASGVAGHSGLTALSSTEPIPSGPNQGETDLVEAAAVTTDSESKSETESEVKFEVKSEAKSEATATAGTGEEIAQTSPHRPDHRDAEDIAPSDAELVEALRLLTPSTGCPDYLTVPSPETMAAAGQLLAEQAVLNAAAGPRWIAEPITLSPEEATLSLEAEMSMTLAAAAPVQESPVQEATIQEWPFQETASETVNDASATETGSGVSALAAAVDYRLAEAHLLPVAEALAEPEHEFQTSEPEAQTTDVAAGPNTAETSPIEATLELAAAETPTLAESAEMQKEAAEHAAGEAPKAMAAAASDGASASATDARPDPGTDASTIASIVDSVMADLRPRIVEEIARKLAKRD